MSAALEIARLKKRLEEISDYMRKLKTEAAMTRVRVDHLRHPAPRIRLNLRCTCHTPNSDRETCPLHCEDK